MKRVSVIGAGSWGTALAVLLAHNGHEVTIWSHDPYEIEMLSTKREQADKLPGVKLPENVKVSSDMEESLKGMDVVVMAVPSPVVRSVAKQMAPSISDGQIIVNVAKGIEDETYMTLTDIIEEEIPNAEVCVLSGPSHAEEVGRGIPTTVVVGSKKKEVAELLQDVFMNEVFRVYTNPDIIGIELGGALKNVIALAAGTTDGLGFGDNTKAALMTRGIAELTRLGVALGGKPETFSGLTGIGDLIVTCTSVHSRNRKAGYLIGPLMLLSPKYSIDISIYLLCVLLQYSLIEIINFLMIKIQHLKVVIRHIIFHGNDPLKHMLCFQDAHRHAPCHQLPTFFK